MIDVTLDGAVWDDVEEGTEALLQDWQVAVGQQVVAGQTLVTLETESVDRQIAEQQAAIAAARAALAMRRTATV